MAYKYQQTVYGGYYGYVKYDITPEIGPGSEIPAHGASYTITGQAYLRDFAIKSLGLTLRYSIKQPGIESPVTRSERLIKMAFTAPKATAKTFTMTVTLPTDFSRMYYRYEECLFYFDIYDADDDDFITGTEPDQYFRIVKYPLNAVITNDFARYDKSAGEFNDEGTSAYLNELTLSINPGVAQEDVTICKLEVLQDEDTIYTRDIRASTTAGMTIADLLAGTFTIGTAALDGVVLSTSLDYIIRLSVSDGYVVCDTPVCEIPRSFANVHLSGNPEGGVAFGKFCDPAKMPAFECAFPAYFYKGIIGVTTFSTDEVDTGGRWIDGRPIYSKTEVWTGSKAAGGEVQMFTSSLSVGTIVCITGYARRSTDNTFFPLCSYTSDNINVPTFWQSDKLIVRNKGFACNVVQATIFYTKSTD